MSVVELIENKGWHLLHIDGYLYYHHSEPKSNVKWKCQEKPNYYVSNGELLMYMQNVVKVTPSKGKNSTK